MPAPELPPLGRTLRAVYGDALALSVAHGRLIAEVARDRLLEVLRFLKDDPRAACELFVDLFGEDYRDFPALKPARFAVTYQLRSLTHGHAVTLRCWVPEADPACPSGVGVYKGCAWTEREAHEMFGIVFQGAPDLRRLLLPEDFDEGFPLRKDYPLRGKGWRDHFEVYPGYEPQVPAEFNRPPPGVYDG